MILYSGNIFLVKFGVFCFQKGKKKELQMFPYDEEDAWERWIIWYLFLVNFDVVNHEF